MRSSAVIALESQLYSSDIAMNLAALISDWLAAILARRREPIDEVAYDYGYRSGQPNDPEYGATNPYRPGTNKHRSWKKGAARAEREEMMIW